MVASTESRLDLGYVRWGLVVQRLKKVPSAETPAKGFGPEHCWRRYGPVHEQADVLRARLHAEEPAIWTADGQKTNVRLRRAFHDTLGVDQAIFVFCDDLLERVYELPWLESWRDELEGIFSSLGIQTKQVIRCLLARLPPGKVIPAHHDTGLWSTRSHRVHVPLVTSDQHGDEDKQVVFKAGHNDDALERVAFETGVAIELNNRAKHNVINNWDQYRVHLIFDYVELDLADELPRLKLQPGQTVVQTRRAIFLDEAAVRAVDYLLAEEKESSSGSSSSNSITSSPDGEGELSAEERVRRSKKLARLWIDAHAGDKAGGGSGGGGGFKYLQAFSRRFADGECTAVDFIIFLEERLGKAGVLEAFGPELDLPLLVNDLERRAALHAAMEARRQVPCLFAVLGAMKCGTTSLYEYIVQHPSIVRAKQKEPHALDWRWDALQKWTPKGEVATQAAQLLDARLATADPKTPSVDRELAERYMNIFEMAPLLERVQAGEFVVSGEATPSYLLGGIAVAKRLRSVAPDARLVVILRDPVERAFSHFQMTRDMTGTPDQLRRRGVVADKTFEELIAEDLARLESTGTLDADLDDVDGDRFEEEYLCTAPMTHGGHSYVGRGFYALQIERWLQVFPREQFLFLRLDRLAANTQAEMARVFRFLGLPPARIADTKPKNTRAYSPIDAETRARLEAIYAPHNDRLVRLLGKEFAF
ncbi:Heparan sulfate glucosamine 3-O-sulfotransferase 4 [Hondaea fermentalgiana]|uniref:Heparan sulfate glucosamine 3-O-sulfotransferase 4 n=1 Tax=Hondaea fermentalgiana TaxID=2315210 RepID=A0A2R5G6V9_9STRA|nr:Heparan sulfate glucosamine 3-O-sulfotransferase 4 [Hondaea fermentalgiana]|eukprot:GBG26797.1 Heparan sulfate glucosamine 3-O-sulfotransferase 4 [Hondaea fermentalgiana]